MATGLMEGEPRPITHHVKFFEKGDKPLEIVTTRQWYITNGGRGEQLRTQLIERGKELQWHPEHMRVRYEHWVNGLAGDWLISRQRFFGVPIPVWYPIDASGAVAWDSPLVPDEADLPVDPSSDSPRGYSPDQRGQAGGFMGDPDVMDTWATSSLTPQLVSGWERDRDLFERVFPMDLRPQGHDIIRTWLFSSVVRAHLENGELPWRHAALSGWILDPDRKKMSKSKGNVVTPLDLLVEHGSDAVRYWAASGRPGTDTAFDVGQMKIGRRLATKILNASKFALGVFGDEAIHVDASLITSPIDRSLIAQLSEVIESSTASFDGFDYARSLEHTERFFWAFCDDYIELAKERAYNRNGEVSKAEQDSARATLALSLSVLLRLFAPIMPFVTEEVWSWWRSGSIHRSSWPSRDELAAVVGDAGVFSLAAEAIALVRKAKSEAKVSMGAPIAAAVLTGSTEQVEALKSAEFDLRSAGRITELTWKTGDALAVEADIAPASN